MLKIFRDIKWCIKHIEDLDGDVKDLQEKNKELHLLLKENSIYAAIGTTIISDNDPNLRKRLNLLQEAKRRGFFEEDSYFVPVTSGWDSTAFFKHHYNDIASNYWYSEKSNSLRIPGIGVKGNFSACTVCIFEQGDWSKVLKDEK